MKTPFQSRRCQRWQRDWDSRVSTADRRITTGSGINGLFSGVFSGKIIHFYYKTINTINIINLLAYFGFVYYLILSKYIYKNPTYLWSIIFFPGIYIPSLAGSLNSNKSLKRHRRQMTTKSTVNA